MISIIIPSYNQEKYLPDAIESALGQTYGCEVLVVDDGSTDNSLEIARKYEGISIGKSAKELKVFSQVNKGLASARNTGIMNAEGDWILPLDADDILQDDALEKIREAMDTYPEADVIAPSFKCFGMSQDNVVLMDNPTLADFKVANRIGYCSAIRKSKLLEIGGYSPKMTWGFEDYHLWFNLLSRGAKIITLKDTLFLYRVKEQSMITSAMEHKDELMSQIMKDFPNVWN